jgi:hypothetical protein
MGACQELFEADVAELRDKRHQLGDRFLRRHPFTHGSGLLLE